MTRFRIALLVCALSYSAVPASAATVGLGGTEVDPPFITDPAWYPLLETECVDAVPLPETYRCAAYDASAFAFTTGISSIDFRLKDGLGALMSVLLIPEGVDVDDASALPALSVSPLYNDGFTFRLSGDAFFCERCIFFSSHADGDFDPAQVSMVGVNGVANPGTTAVPEPATLLLLGPGAVLALRRRWRRRA